MGVPNINILFRSEIYFLQNKSEYWVNISGREDNLFKI